MTTSHTGGAHKSAMTAVKLPVSLIIVIFTSYIMSPLIEGTHKTLSSVIFL